ncbi:MAG TPA: hypothetical protein VKR29_03855 [Candidatus Binataceae bacterium]|nr:hypothetical protein [Candidatus Binataceae bacterium]
MLLNAFRMMVLVGSIFALAGCAQFQDSFGEITDAFDSAAEQPAPSSNLTATAQSPDSGAGQKKLAVGGVMVQLSDGRLME